MNIQPSVKQLRIPSIDVFRAITMFLMIFVNDFWTITGVPHGLGHAGAKEDFLGFSDLIFPAFLFILGMSIPSAIESRISKGESRLSILKHILLRTGALLVMGLFTVSTESDISATNGLNRTTFTLLAVGAFFLIWNLYPKTTACTWKKWLFLALKLLGIILLIYLAIVFRDAQGGNFFHIRWWGILGLIGWTYCLCAPIYLFIRKNHVGECIAWAFFILLCIAGSNSWLGIFQHVLPGNGVFHAFSMGGVVVSLLFTQWRLDKQPFSDILLRIVPLGLLLLLLGWCSHSFWIISKIGGTPPWLFLCSGISLLFYLLIYWLVDNKKKAAWFNCIQPAGTATLTCYLIPYLLYPIFSIVHFSLPENWLHSPAGLLKCVAFAFFTIGITFLLGKIGIKLKI